MRATVLRLVSRNPGQISGRPFVAMMQATDFRDGDDSSDAAMLNPALAGITILTEQIRIGSFVF